MTQKADKNKVRKERAVKYYRNVPIYRYTAMHIGISEDTLGRWRDEDADFAERLRNAKSEWVQNLLPNVKPEFALERLEREVFAPPTNKHEVHNSFDPVKILLAKFGVTEVIEGDRKDNGAIQASSKIST